MKIENKNLLIAFATLLLCGLVIVWMYPLNKGMVEVTASVPGFSIAIQNTAVACETSPCTLKFKTGTYTLRVLKEDFVTYEEEIKIKRFKTISVKAELKKINKLVAVEGIPAFVQSRPKLSYPPDISFDFTLTPAWNNSASALLYLEKETGLLKLYEAGVSKVISTLKSPAGSLSVKWAPGKEKALLLGETEAYLIGIPEGSRIKMPLSFKITAALWDPAGAKIYLNDEEGTLYRLEGTKIETMPAKTNLNLSTWMDENRLLTLTQENFGASLDLLNPETGDRQTLLYQGNLKASEIQYDLTGKKAYIKNESDGKWYEMEF
jgi:hypothetical protein